MIFDKRKLYPLWGLTIVFVMVFFVGLNWWRVEHVSPEFSSTGKAIYIAALIGSMVYRNATIRNILKNKEVQLLDSFYGSLPESSFSEKIYWIVQNGIGNG